MTARVFHLGDILSVTTERLVSPGGFAAVHELLDYMTGDTLMFHQLPRAAEECQPELLRQYPGLRDVAVPVEFRNEGHVWRWLHDQMALFGRGLPVEPLAPGDHTVIDPVAEYRMMAPRAEVIAVEVPPDGDLS